MVVNGFLAPDETVRVRAEIKQIRHSDDEYVVEVEPRGSRFEQDIDLDYGGDPDRLDEKCPARVVSSNVALGYPWVQSYTLPVHDR
jgi:hypothetical protein